LALNAVPGEGNPKAEIMFIGEAPGRKEDESGLPFVGKSGKFLDVLLRKIKLDRKKVFITSVLKHRPPNNRKPKPHELSACRVWWKKQMEIINPKVVVLLGEVAYKEVLQRNDFSKKRGEVIKIDNRIYLPTFHPSAAVRFSKFRKVLIKDFNKILNKARL
jgi:DNA polymerase